MDFYPIHEVTISCPICKTGIKLNVASKDDAEMEKLITASESFACPVCEAKLGSTYKALQCANKYNAVVAMLNNYKGLFDIEFE